MNGDAVVAALDLPLGSRVDRRVPKKLLMENGAPTAADKRHINEAIEELLWLAALKPTTIGVPEYRDGVREYLEIAVLRLVLRLGTKAGRIVELVHRAVPYPVLLLTEQAERTNLSAAHKRWAQNETDKMVLDGDVIAVDCDTARDVDYLPAFRAALALGRQPHTVLFALYQGWIDTLLALQAARVTGNFSLPANRDHATARHMALGQCAKLSSEIARLRAAAAKEKQVARQVQLNLELKRAEAVQAATRAKL